VLGDSRQTDIARYAGQWYRRLRSTSEDALIKSASSPPRVLHATGQAVQTPLWHSVAVQQCVTGSQTQNSLAGV